MMLPFALPLWLAGLVWLFAHPLGKRYRLLGWVYLTVFAILITSGSSRSGYLAPAYTWLFAAGGVAIEGWFARPRLAWVRPAYAAVLIATGAAIAPLALPLLPVETYIAYARMLGETPGTEERKELGELGQFYADMHGWDAIVATLVRRATARFRPTKRRSPASWPPTTESRAPSTCWAAGRAWPPALSGHNNYWLWGPRGWDGRVAHRRGRDRGADARRLCAGRAGGDDRMRALHAVREQPAGVDRTIPPHAGRGALAAAQALRLRSVSPARSCSRRRSCARRATRTER